jgi:hypothetical protein
MRGSFQRSCPKGMSRASVRSDAERVWGHRITPGYRQAPGPGTGGTATRRRRGYRPGGGQVGESVSEGAPPSMKAKDPLHR